MDKKRTRGRQKIAITKIQKDNDCFATFSKRRLGLFKKASELSSLCNVDLGVFIFSPTGKPFSFFHPSMESVITRFQNPNYQGPGSDSSRLVEAYTRTRVLQLNQMLDKLDQQLEAELERERQLDCLKNEMGRQWWDEPVENLDNEQKEQLIGLLGNLQFQLRSRLEKELKKPAS